MIWPKNFPDNATMMDILKKTVETSWKIELSEDEVKQWLANFTGEVCEVETEKRIALWMLCNFTYYNENEINYLCRIVYKYFLHDIAKTLNINKKSELKQILDNVYFAAMGNAGESGNLLLYHFRQESKLSIDRFYYPTTIPENPEGIVAFIDDVTLSGGTASRFFYQNVSKMKFKKVYYLTLFASEEAINKISQHNIKVIYANQLGDRDKCFSNRSLMFAEFPDLRDTALKIAKQYGEKLDARRALGHKNGQYCFGLSYNTPNNTLPIFWSENNWYPVFKRKEKIQNVRQRENEFDKYI